MILQVSAGSSWLVRGAAALVLSLHITGATAGVAPFLPDRISTVAAVLTFYLAATAWVTVRRKEGSAGLFEFGSGVVALSIAVAGVTFGLQAANSATGLIEGQPAGTGFMFATVAVFAAIGDLSIIARRGIAGARRIARHLWRMCFALFIAAGSFFLGQRQVFPASMRGSSLLFLPEIAVLGLMIFWLVRVRFTSPVKQVHVPPATRWRRRR